MPQYQKSPSTKSRKADHIRINLEEDVQFPNVTTGLEKYRFMHQALPELNLTEIDTEIRIFDKVLSAPVLISSMTGGTELAEMINRNLAEAAQTHNIAMGLGSQRAALEDDTLALSFSVRKIAPDILLFANVGAVQLNYGYTAEDCQRAVDMVQADALILHFNVLQEAVQPEGDINWAGLLDKIENVCKRVSVPVIAKEVGWGFSREAVQRLVDVGVAAIDVAGSGGTSWSEVEYHRAPTDHHARVAAAFADWGIPTADAICYATEVTKDLPIIASGGIRNGIDIAKSIALGATLGGMAGPFLKAAVQSSEAVSRVIQETNDQLRIAMLCSAASDIASLRKTPLYRVNEL
jgi:isopentenyl-diphosphate delta-isomerase